jgi:hypothetical protein
MENSNLYHCFRGKYIVEQNIPIKIVSIGENGSGAIQTIRLVK